MALSAGNLVTVTDYNSLKTSVANEASRRSRSFSPTAISSGTPARSADINKIIALLNGINSSTTNFSATSAGSLLKAIVQLSSATTTFAGKPKVGSNSGCASGCVGLCQGCSGTCTGSCTSCSGCSGSCTGSCTGCSGSCTGGCTSCSGCSGTCSGSCSGGCQGAECQGNGCSGHCSGGCGSIFQVDISSILEVIDIND